MTHSILVIDTATEACSVALKTPDDEARHFEICPQQHSQKILPLIDQVCRSAGTCIQDIDILGFGHGPGSFTGVRIAISTVQGLALGLNIPAVGVSTLAAMAQQVFQTSQATECLVAIDARMGEVYFAHYQHVDGIAMLVGQESVLSPFDAACYVRERDLAALKTMALAGTGWQAYPEMQTYISQSGGCLVTLPNARYMLALVEQSVSRQQQQRVDELEPVYLRNTVTWKKLPGRE
ncbi:tRNA (adenosine(37)-N6)-threonylcarbamoyltransferase complex dimerization subunit type 1 TsaB [Alteromonas oceanisediminis]|uniref:tRNA (adenosine(37)-N6)-threonylcarbamoyltransferase complex dimerization subunit type 1 TsaB n=1 Tax=Alteromonas oceanisediminis TaxID=2836180 RepID=UPI001BDA1F2C|nr:tRNA (adenosine(37)-N6)-threonylcarbamoyltransferase complex dimerization subunit type 1 TsaB [Alteromonas oceanisediminis]MBT0587464.1 tRNA (adenosine(37)-N6)-threonylcarbamoyltransferase complex dimerization subunit type 1 TsaB [Alteromonas oceanisediminis]